MSLLSPVSRLNEFAGRILTALQAPALLAARLYVSWVLLKSGYLKFSSWESTLGLFRDEYQVPLLPPDVAAVAGTAGEPFFPVLPVLGLWGRLGALCQHLLWAVLVGAIALFGSGKLPLDHWLEKMHQPARPH